jgi:hypothetical protein
MLLSLPQHTPVKIPAEERLEAPVIPTEDIKAQETEGKRNQKGQDQLLRSEGIPEGNDQSGEVDQLSSDLDTRQHEPSDPMVKSSPPRPVKKEGFKIAMG